MSGLNFAPASECGCSFPTAIPRTESGRFWPGTASMWQRNGSKLQEKKESSLCDLWLLSWGQKAHCLLRAKRLFFPRAKVFYFSGQPTGRGSLQLDGIGRVAFQGALELFIGFGWREGIIHRPASGAQLLHQAERFIPQCFIFNQAKHINPGVEFRQQPARLQQLEQDHVSHAKPER